MCLSFGEGWGGVGPVEEGGLGWDWAGGGPAGAPGRSARSTYPPPPTAARDLFPAQGLPQENPGQDGDLRQHGVVDHAGFDGRQGAQGVIPQSEGKGGVDHRQPGDDQPVRPAQPAKACAAAPLPSRSSPPIPMLTVVITSGDRPVRWLTFRPSKEEPAFASTPISAAANPGPARRGYGWDGNRASLPG